VNAEPYFKRVLAERAVLEIKLRMAIQLGYLGGGDNGWVYHQF
jgi:hypothetical protein